jgi:hypothetical protein
MGSINASRHGSTKKIEPKAEAEQSGTLGKLDSAIMDEAKALFFKRPYPLIKRRCGIFELHCPDR